MKLLTRRGLLIEEQGQAYLADTDGDSDEARVLRPLQAAACTYRIAFGPRGGQKVLTLQGAMPPGDGLQANAVRRHQRVQPACRRALRRRRSPGAGATVSLHHPSGTGHRTGAAQRHRASGAEAEGSLGRGPTHLVMSPLEFMPLRIELPLCGRQFHWSYVSCGSEVQVRCRREQPLAGHRRHAVAVLIRPPAAFEGKFRGQRPICDPRPVSRTAFL